jgi:hypothetical protein
MVKVTECGGCGHYHLAPLTGDLYRDDCRYDANRFDFMDLDRMFGENGWEDVTEEEECDE